MAITEHGKPARILVAGCGALGGRIARSLSRDHDVFGLRRNPDRVPPTVNPVGADLLNRTELASALPSGVEALVYCLTPNHYDDNGYRDAYITGLENLLASLDLGQLRQIVFISSTSVYQQNDDSWVDETSPTQPDRVSGQCILAGEQLVLDSGVPATVARLSGIYGPTRRRFLDSVVRGEMNPDNPSPYTNRIHEADATDAVVHLLNLALNGTTLASHYLISDCEPVRLADVVAWIRRRTPCAEPAADARTGGRAGSKRCSNQRLLDSGFRFRYPDYRAGYGEMIAEPG